MRDGVLRMRPHLEPRHTAWRLLWHARFVALHTAALWKVSRLYFFSDGVISGSGFSAARELKWPVIANAIPELYGLVP